MKRMKLNNKEKVIENRLISGEYKNASNKERKVVFEALKRRNKDIASSRS